VRRWIRGYDSAPLFKRQHQGSRLALTFLDLVEVLVLKAFLDSGVSIHTVRLVQREAAEEFGVQYPFCVKRFETDGETIVLRHRDDAVVERMHDGKRKQRLFVEVFNPLLKTLEYAGIEREARRWWPMGEGHADRARSRALLRAGHRGQGERPDGDHLRSASCQGADGADRGLVRADPRTGARRDRLRGVAQAQVCGGLTYFLDNNI
jgi:hypothetical protein